MADKFRCSLCLDQFIDPRILSCFHTFCRDCLKEYVRKSTSWMLLSKQEFECPLCRTRNTLPSTGVEGIQKNFYLDEPMKKAPEPNPQMCSKHRKEDLRFFCCDCRERICRDCKIVSHEGHATDMVDNVVAEMNVTLEKSLTEANRSIKENGASLLGTIEPELKGHKRTITVLTTHTEKVKKAIDRLLNESLAVIQPLHDRGEINVRDIRAQTEEKTKEIYKYKKMLSKAVKTNDNIQVIKLFDKLIDHEEIKELKAPPLMSKLENASKEVNEELLKHSYVRFIDTIMHDIEEFKIKGFTERQSQKESKQHTVLSNTASEFEFRGVDPGYEAAIMEEMGRGKLSSNTKPITKCASKVSKSEVDSGQELKGQWYRKDKEEPCSRLIYRQKGKKGKNKTKK